MPTRRDQIIDTAVLILELEPNGKTCSELIRSVKGKFPNYSEHYIRDNITLLDRFEPDKVYKPERGVFRQIKYRD
jgi:hypothetical protein